MGSMHERQIVYFVWQPNYSGSLWSQKPDFEHTPQAQSCRIALEPSAISMLLTCFSQEAINLPFFTIRQFSVS
jgi:hypothetical protein